MKPGVHYIGVCVPFYCNDGKGNFLLHKRSNLCRDEKGRWDPGSGQLEFGETPEEAVLREVKEEYGIRGRIQEKLPAHSIIRKNGRTTTHWLAIPFFVRAEIKEARIMEPDRATELGVFRLNRLPRPLHTGFQITRSMYKKRFDAYSKS